MSFFDRMIEIRIRNEEYKDIKRLVNERDLEFYNVSHFCRSAIIKMIRELKEKKEKVKPCNTMNLKKGCSKG